MAGDTSDDAPGRRGFIVVAAAGTCAIAATVGIPAALFVAAPLGTAAAGTPGKRYVVARLDELEIGVPKKVAIVGDEIDAWTRAKDRRLGAVWLLRVSDQEVRALSVVCPHLGCGVELTIDAGKPKGFACPCHDSAFDLSGQRIAGPSPRAMDPLPVELTPAGEVAVTFKRFRTGVDKPEEIGG
jgi:menaquinol-cytochrome c reductase iron-sulfur subunit